MKKKALFSLLLVLIMTVSITIIAQAKNGSPMGSFSLNQKQFVKVQDQRFVPVDEVARVLSYRLDWELNKNRVRGRFNNHTFSVDNFIVAYGHLYLPIEFFTVNFGIEIEIRGNHYIIYRIERDIPDLELVIQTDKDEYDSFQPIAVSILLLNDSNHTSEIKYSSGQRYDLVIERYGREIWRLSDGKGFIQSITIEKLQPGDYHLYTVMIKPSFRFIFGECKLYAEIPTTEGTIRSNEIELQID